MKKSVKDKHHLLKTQNSTVSFDTENEILTYKDNQSTASYTKDFEFLKDALDSYYECTLTSPKKNLIMFDTHNGKVIIDKKVNSLKYIDTQKFQIIEDELDIINEILDLNTEDIDSIDALIIFQEKIKIQAKTIANIEELLLKFESAGLSHDY